MRDHVLITGGAGFIGSHLSDELLRRGYRVRVLDNLSPQVHESGAPPPYLNREVEFVHGDVRDRDAVRRSLQGIDAVFHLAARVGVGQSMYRIEDYTAINNVGTAVLFEEMVHHRVQRAIVASSMSVYGEGACQRENGDRVDHASRNLDQLRRASWELADMDGAPLTPVPTDETKRVALESVYALSKYDQERLFLICGRAYGVPTVALRLFNVYGPRQALSNPYTGVLAIFAARLLNDQRPSLFEDGLQMRDFVSVHDVVRAAVLALQEVNAPGHAINVGSGIPRTIRDVARAMAKTLHRPHLVPEVTGKYRHGDIRHCFADISLAGRVLGYRPQVAFEAGLEDLAIWLDGQAAKDRAPEAHAELETRGLTL